MYSNIEIKGKVSAVPRPSAGRMGYSIKWDASSFPDKFPTARYALSTEIPNTNAMKTLLQQAIIKADTVGYTFNASCSNNSSISQQHQQQRERTQRRVCTSAPLPDSVLFIAGMSSTLPPIKEEDGSDSEENLSDGGSEADELDNSFARDTNIASDKEDEQHGDDNGAGIVNKW
eukprot:10813264-Ditylum_brightwellii.AAC.1